MVKLMKIPKSRGVALVDSDSFSFFYEQRDKFFINIKEYLESKNQDSNLNDFEIRVGNLLWKGLNLDESFSYVLYKDNIVAGILETRTALNHLYFTYFRSLHPLDNSFDFDKDFLLKEKIGLGKVLDSSILDFKIRENSLDYLVYGKTEDKITFLRYKEKYIFAGIIEYSIRGKKRHTLFRNLDALEDVQKKKDLFNCE